MLRCAGNDDCITLRAKDDSDSMEIFIENTDQDRTSTFEVKLMDIDQERLGIPVSDDVILCHNFLFYDVTTFVFMMSQLSFYDVTTFFMMSQLSL